MDYKLVIVRLPIQNFFFFLKKYGQGFDRVLANCFSSAIVCKWIGCGMTLVVFSCLRSRRLFKRRLAINIVASMLPKKLKKGHGHTQKRGPKRKRKSIQGKKS